MSKKVRFILGALASLLILIAVASFIANPIIENKIKKTIAQEIPEEYEINNYQVTVKSFSGSASIENLQATIKDTIAGFKNSRMSLSKASIKGFSYWKYLFLNKIAVEDIALYDLQIITHKDTVEKNTHKKQQEKFKENISIDKFTLYNASFLNKKADESSALEIDSLHLSITNIKVNKSTLKEKIPFQFSEIELDCKDFYLDLKNNETLSFKEFTIDKQQLKVKAIEIQSKTDSLKIAENNSSKFGKKDIKIPTLTLNKLHFKVVDDTFQLLGENLEVEKPSVWILQGKNKETPKETNKNNEIPLPFSIKSISVNDAQISVLTPDKKTYLKIDDFSFSLKDVSANPNTIQQNIPYQFSDMELESKNLHYHLNEYDLLSINTISLVKNQLEIEDLAIKTIHSKAKLSKVISRERDFMDVKMPLVTLNNLQFKVVDTTFQVLSNALKIENPVLNIYRDKLVADDTSIKPLYSKSIRNIPFPLTVDSLFINNATIVYEEKVKEKLPAGAINFLDLNASIGNLSNTYSLGEKKTTIQIAALFMDKTPLKINWNFDVKDPEDTFQIQGELGTLNATKMNSFTKASLNVELEGEVNKTYFNIHGNNESSSIDLNINYDDFKIEILNKENERSWFLSTIANIFVKKNSDSEGGTFKEGKATAQRNKDKSFFNYLWINIQEGLKKVMVAL